MRLQAEAAKAEIEAKEKAEIKRRRIEVDAEKVKAETAEKAEKLKYAAEKERRDAEVNKLKLEAETVRARMKHEYRMKEIETRNLDMGAGSDGKTNINNINNSFISISRNESAEITPI